MDNTINDFSIGLFTWQALILLSIGLWIYCLIDILKNKFAQNDKIILGFSSHIDSIYWFVIVLVYWKK